MYFNLISIFELKIARPSLECSFKVQRWSLEDDYPNTQLFTRVEVFMRSGMVIVADLIDSIFFGMKVGEKEERRKRVSKKIRF